MVMNTWWDDDPTQRYWVEITDGADIGAHLQSPNLGGNPSEPGYDSVSLIAPGDVVIHYDTRQMVFVGWSTVSGPAYSVPNYKWTPKNQKEERDSVGVVDPTELDFGLTSEHHCQKQGMTPLR